MSDLLDAQLKFCELSAGLVPKAIALGYRVKWGETLRSKEQAAANAAAGSGIVKSNHLIGLAVDLVLFTSGGIYLTHPRDYQALGEWWKQQHPLARWGGDFHDALGNSKPDSDHFSFVWNGVK